MDLRHLRYYVSIAQEGSVSRASKRLNISQPSLSRQLRDLEAELGVLLFERTGRSMKLTVAGEELLTYARGVLNNVEGFMDRAKALGRGDAGILRVGASPQILQRLLPGALTRLNQALPDVEVRLTEGDARSLFAGLRSGTINLAIAADSSDSRFSSEPLGLSPICAVCRQREFGDVYVVDVTVLANARLLLPTSGFDTRRLFEFICKTNNIEADVYLESASPHTLLALAEAGAGIAVLPGTVDFDNRDLSIYRLIANGMPLEMRFSAQWDSQRYLPPCAECLIDELKIEGARIYADPLIPGWRQSGSARAIPQGYPKLD